MQTLSLTLNRRDPDKINTLSKKSNLSLVDEMTSVGVEIEMENLATNYMSRVDLQNWERKSDGSLRGNSREFVFDKPLRGDVVIAALESLSSAFEDERFEKHKTLRTSMHVHVNMLNVNRTQLLAVLIAALLADKALFNMTEENRQYLGYCRESEEALISTISYLHMEPENPDEIRLYSAGNRYYSMNAAALSKYGTIEFRHFSTPVDIEEAVKNINACLTVKRCGLDAWESAGTENVRKDLEAMYNLVRAQIEAAFGTDHEMITIEEFLEQVEAAKALIEYAPIDNLQLETELMQVITQETAVPETPPIPREVPIYRREAYATFASLYGSSETSRTTLSDNRIEEFLRTGVMPRIQTR